MFGSKRLAALEARVAALEPKQAALKQDPLKDPYQYQMASDTPKDPIKALTERVEKIEEEVMPQSWSPYMTIYTLFYGGGDKAEKMTLKRKVERILEHLKIQFVTEPQRTVIKPVKKSKG